MKILIIVLISSVAILSAGSPELWQEFKLTHGKAYESSSEEDIRFTIFLENLQVIEEHNKKYKNGEVTYKLGINNLADMTVEEFSAMLKLSKPSIPNDGQKTFVLPKNAKVPDQIDWRKRGAVTSVRNQKRCGACWAISAVASLEGQYFLTNGTLVPLSPQQLVDCATAKYNNSGCLGGTMDNAFNYIKVEGIESEKNYPYVGKNGICKHTDDKVLFKINGYVNVKANEDSLKQAVGTVGPISVAVTTPFDWMFYQEGIYQNSNCPTGVDTQDHAIVAVGYATSNGQDYWLLKNSWSEDWGEKGYIRLARNANNQCGVANQASYPYL